MLSSQILKQAIEQQKYLLTEIESKNLLKEIGVPVIETRLAKTKREAIDQSKKLGFPVVLKIASPDIIHKSDSGGVKLDLKNATQVGHAYSDILSSIRRAFPQAIIQGVSVQKMARPGIEVIIGISQDAQFGPVIMFGIGGILVEIIKDVSFRIIPLMERDAAEMIREIKGYRLLQGYRGQEPANIPKLEQLILKISQFIEQNPQIKELDLNPIYAYQDDITVVDARIILGSSTEE